MKIKAKNKKTGEVREFVRFMNDFGFLLYADAISKVIICEEETFNSEWEVINKNTQNVDIGEQDVNKTDIEERIGEIINLNK